ncbi:hypothetical protein [Pseudomonas sp. GV071]|jgi:hypothetical protein|uniref:hypothetical protein n=1 Tax=Pseudomonas sp. GV071 TaxID=2135754 RepID=UPI000D349958|nr:hypothetical protein [Pseudomonas sp. GV071]PTQ67850.1 hypothetical protein C8K61_11322 [Pseudomonas sp. GV071]
MSPFKALAILACATALSACGLGETAATASLQAKQAQQAQQQMKDMQQQIDAANAVNNERLKQATEQQ